MLKNLNYCLLALVCVSVAATGASGAIVSYNLFIDGDDSPVQMLPAGTYNLVVQAIVTDNDLAPNTPGGLLQSAIDLTDANNAIQWTDAAGGFIGGPDGNWDSTANAAFDSHFQGVLQDGGTDAIAETGAIAPGDFTGQFNDIGANVWSLITQGTFNYDGSETVLDLVVANPGGGDIVVAALSGSVVVGSIPDEVNFDSIQLTLIPEPASLALFGVAMIGIVASRRRMA